MMRAPLGPGAWGSSAPYCRKGIQCERRFSASGACRWLRAALWSGSSRAMNGPCALRAAHVAQYGGCEIVGRFRGSPLRV